MDQHLEQEILWRNSTSLCQMGKLGNFDFTGHFHFSGIFDNFNNWVIG